ncbi:hypothetical protein DSD19_04545 [Rhodovulum sp. BSW8]|uniref:hypothetical protein n=1 Tax=Rhodovulum sp. BSW8 TaxID=2259645 RepID=UPI000DE54983|nr:hypothetical protein [Rhodovulum sp. BSW8]RBO54650.1 hypothetical protein DSD19_04545 [Rhodovulum sp. BSW8]
MTYFNASTDMPRIRRLLEAVEELLGWRGRPDRTAVRNADVARIVERAIAEIRTDVSGSFTTTDGKTVTITKGIVTRVE